MIGFWCKISIELIWVSTYGQMEEKHTFWAFLETCTGTPLDLYRYSPPEPNLYRYRCGTGAVHPALF